MLFGCTKWDKTGQKYRKSIKEITKEIEKIKVTKKCRKTIVNDLKIRKKNRGDRIKIGRKNRKDRIKIGRKNR